MKFYTPIKLYTKQTHQTNQIKQTKQTKQTNQTLLLNSKFTGFININKNFISSKIQISSKENDYQSVISLSRIPINEIILIEYPCATLYGEEDIDRGLQTIRNYFILADGNTNTNTNTNLSQDIKNLYPRSNDIYTFPRTALIKQIHKIIKNLSNINICNPNKKLQDFFNKYTKIEIEFYYAKYIFNAFEGYEFGPLTLPYFAKFNHSCNNNITFNFDKTSGTMIARTNCIIEPNQELFISYLSNKNILNHKEYLYDHYGFITNCKCK